MIIFNNIIDELRDYIDTQLMYGNAKEFNHKNLSKWPQGTKRDIILKSDVGIELGNPKDESISFMLWTDTKQKINHGKIYLIGPDLNESKSLNLPFGKILILNVNGFNEDNAYERYRQLDLLRYDILLDGYMMRAVSQNMREWSRVSKKALKNGFSLLFLAEILIEKYSQIDYIDSVEVLMITDSSQIKKISKHSQKVINIINAMSKMNEELSFDCNSCDYQEICNEASELKLMRKTLKNRALSNEK